jgi:hypothetical protein
MKTVLALVLGALVAAVALSSAPAHAFPGAMCFNATGCSRCEVCVKERPLDVSGKCLVIQGCY